MYDITSLKPFAKSETVVITSPVRYVSGSLFAPRTDGEYPSHKYEITVAFDAHESPELLTVLQAAITAAEQRGSRDLWGDPSPLSMTMHRCLRARVEYDAEGVATPTTSFYLTARSDYEPKHFDASRTRLTCEEELYPGCLVRLQLELYPWYRSQEARGGVSASLLAVQKLPSPSTSVDMDDFYIPQAEPLEPTTASTEELLGDDGADLS